jgi:hypothetical protein
VGGWWLALVLRPAWRATFRPEGAPDIVLLALAPGDLLMLGVGSALVALPGGRLGGASRPLAWVVAGATLYGAIYTLALTVAGAVSPLGAILMSPAALASTLAAFVLDDHVRSISPGGAR